LAKTGDDHGITPKNFQTASLIRALCLTFQVDARRPKLTNSPVATPIARLTAESVNMQLSVSLSGIFFSLNPRLHLNLVVSWRRCLRVRRALIRISDR